MGRVVKVNIGLDFSQTPYGRYPKDGPHNGQAFRQNVLLPLMRDGDVDAVHVLLDDVQKGYEYGSSFFHEAFGVLVRDEGFSSEDVRKKVVIQTKHQDYIDEIYGYINDPGER